MIGPRLNFSTEQTSPRLDMLLALIKGSGSFVPIRKVDNRRSLNFGAISPVVQSRNPGTNMENKRIFLQSITISLI